MAADTDPTLLALARENERTTRRVGELETLLARLADDVTALGQANDPDPAPGVRAWLQVTDPDTAAADLADLTEWLAAVYLRYAGSALPSCWAWHPDVTEELWTLRQAHCDAYSGRGASPQRAADWHDRLRPGVVTRVREAAGGCELALHTPGGELHRPAPRVPLAEATDAIAHHWTTERTAPDPTPTQLQQAEQHDREQHARSHR